MSISKNTNKINTEEIIEEEMDITSLIEKGEDRVDGLVLPLRVGIILLGLLLCTGIFMYARLDSSRPHIYLEDYESHNVTMVEGARGGEEGEVVVVGSVNGSKYHYPWCSGAKQIKEANIIEFKNVTEARLAGYEPAKNCPGL